jgi:hypothetical protein
MSAATKLPDGAPPKSRPPPVGPSVEAWRALSPHARERFLDRVAAALTEEALRSPEARPHRSSRDRAHDALSRWFTQSGRPVYLCVNEIVQYPGSRGCCPDLFAVVGVPDPGPEADRRAWVVADEGRGIDLVLEVLYSGDRDKAARPRRGPPRRRRGPPRRRGHPPRGRGEPARRRRSDRSKGRGGPRGGAARPPRRVLSPHPGPSFRPSGPSHRPSGPSHRPSGPSHCPSGPSHCPSGPSHCPSGPSHCPSGPSHRPSGPCHCPSGPCHCPSGPSRGRSPPRVNRPPPQPSPTSGDVACRPTPPGAGRPLPQMSGAPG